VNERGFVDGALVDPIRIPFGFWEAKDLDDDLDKQIAAKFRKGYPQDNIIFEDSAKAVPIQNKQEVMRCDVERVGQLEELLNRFFDFENPNIARFRKAVEQFTADLKRHRSCRAGYPRLPGVSGSDPPTAGTARSSRQAKATIHPNVSADDIRARC
jgi:hypothetical protein